MLAACITQRCAFDVVLQPFRPLDRQCLQGVHCLPSIHYPRQHPAPPSTPRYLPQRNFLEVYRYQSWGGQDALPVFQQGQTFMPAAIDLKQASVHGCPWGGLVDTKWLILATAAVLNSSFSPNPALQGTTQPPPRLTERDLIAKMEEYGIGTDATVADHIQKQVGRRVWDGTCFVAPVWASGSQPRRAAANAEGKLLFTWLAELTGCSSHLVYRSNPAQQTLLLPRCCSWSVGMR